MINAQAANVGELIEATWQVAKQSDKSWLKLHNQPADIKIDLLYSVEAFASRL